MNGTRFSSHLTLVFSAETGSGSVWSGRCFTEPSAVIVEKGMDAALAQHRVLKQSNDYYVTENQLNALGYRLLGAKKVKEAIEIFKLNVEAYPQSMTV